MKHAPQKYVKTLYICGDLDYTRNIIIEIHEDVLTIGNTTTTEEETTPGFYSHRFMLATRAPYFYDQLITYGLKNLPRRRVMDFCRA